MKKYILVAILMHSMTLYSHALDTLAVEQIHYDRYRTDRLFNGGVRLNPSLFFHSGNHSLSEVSIGGCYEDGSLMLQQGDMKTGFTFNSNSFVLLNDKSRVWGAASYNNSLRRNVIYNNSSDFLLLYPYIMADSIGGDMKSETYAFRGGYGIELGRYTVSAEFSYRATSEYRNVDPRPKNIVSDLSVTVALARSFKHYRVAVSLGAGKYKQSNTVKFFSELGATPIYHLTGLGSDYARFRGTFLSSLYDGASYGASVDIVPVSGDGLSLSMGYHSFGYNKQLGDVNDLLLNSLRTNTGRIEASFIQDMKGIKIVTHYTTRAGRDYIYGSPTGQFYPLITQTDNYSNRSLDATVSGLYGCEIGRHTLFIEPLVGYRSIAIDHLGEQNRVRVSSIGYGADLSWNISFRNSNFTTSLGVNHRYTLASDLLFNNEKFKPLLISYRELLLAHNMTFDAKVRYSLTVASSGGALFGEVVFAQENYTKQMIINSLSLSVGFIF